MFPCENFKSKLIEINIMNKTKTKECERAHETKFTKAVAPPFVIEFNKLERFVH